MYRRAGPVAARRDGICFALTSLDLLKAEVEYANRKSVLLFRALNPVDGGCERAADESAAPARSAFAHMTLARSSSVAGKESRLGVLQGPYRLSAIL